MSRHIPDNIIDLLQSRGLLVGDPFPEGHIAWPLGRSIGKPMSKGGNSLPEYECHWSIGDGEEVIVDAPVTQLHFSEGFWHVTVHEYVPGPGPGDFVHSHSTIDLAVQDIIDYYFGDPSRIRVKLESY